FMATLNKTIRASIADNVAGSLSFPLSYASIEVRRTPPPKYLPLTCRKMIIGLPDPPITSPTHQPVHNRIVENDRISKCKMANYADAKRHTQPSNL
ncbi:MAG: hypothetical protein M3H12_20340, partial [Chromatiales bacterium]